MFRPPTSRHSWSSRLLLLVLLLAATGLTWSATQTQPAALAAPAVLPYLWGTNLSLYTQNDFFLTNPATAKLTQQLHVQMIRFPDRGNLAVTTAAAKQIQALHAVPLLVLHYGAAQVSANTALIQMMKTVFGNQIVYYEYGNEMDLPQNGGIDAATYTSSWNTVIPQLQALAPTARFIGPVNFQANPTYVGYFVQHASPQPFGVSWHEYTCSTQDSDQYCLSHIDNWTAHIQATRQAMGKNLPILITEYNWNPNPAGDPRVTNATFLQQWMQRAMTVLIQNQVFAANQYVLTNNAQLAMISDSTHTLTGAGIAFEASFEQSVGTTGGTPTSVPPTTPSVTVTMTPITTPSMTPVSSTPMIPPSATVTTTPIVTPSTTPVSTPTVTPSATAEPSSLLCFQVQTQSGSQTSSTPQWLCVPVVSTSNNSSNGQPVGTVCLPLYPATSQTNSATTPTASAVRTICLPAYEETPSVPTSTPTPVPTIINTPTATPPLLPTSTPTVQPSPESTPGMTPTVKGQGPSSRATPTTVATPFIGS